MHINKSLDTKDYDIIFVNVMGNSQSKERLNCRLDL